MRLKNLPEIPYERDPVNRFCTISLFSAELTDMECNRLWKYQQQDFWVVSVIDHFLDVVKWNAHVQAEFFDGQDLMVGLTQRRFYGLYKAAAVALAFAGDALDVFGVNAEADGSGFHEVVYWCDKVY